MYIALGLLGFLAMAIGIIMLIINAIRRKSILKWGIAALCGFVFMIIGIALSESNTSDIAPTTSPVQAPAPSASPDQEPEPPQDSNIESPNIITAKELWQEVDLNSVAADVKYEGVILLVSGEVSSISEGGWRDENWNEIGVVHIWLNAGFLSSIYCYFDSIDEVLPLVEGQDVVIQGTFKKAASFGVDMIHCTVVQY